MSKVAVDRNDTQKRAADIADLEEMLNNALSDAELCARSVEIYERLKEAKKNMRYRVDIDEAKRIDQECLDFINVLGEIKDRRHPKALDQFKAEIKKIGGDVIAI